MSEISNIKKKNYNMTYSYVKSLINKGNIIDMPSFLNVSNHR